MKSRLFIMVALLLLFLNACSNNEPVTKESEETEKLEKITLMLDWYPNAVHSFLYAAQEKGYFEEKGLKVDIQMPADTNDPLRLVAANQIDMAISYQPQVIIARAEQIPVQSFAAIVRNPLIQLMVPGDSPIQTPKDLEDRSVGYPSIPLDEAIIQRMVENDGGDMKKVKMVDIGWDLIPAIATKRTDAIIGGFINHEKILLEKEGHSIRTIDPAQYGVPNYYELVFVSSEKGLAEKPDVYKKFMAAVTKGYEFVKSQPEEGLSLLLKHEESHAPLEEDVEKKSLEILLPLMDAGEKPFGHQELADWEKVGQWLLETNLIKQKVDPETAFVNL
jgi:putative hydroxymethylpyrimidine transport system substrate-binding protein